MFNRNYFDLADLIETSCKYCGIVAHDEIYARLVSICTKYFWGDIYKPEFQEQINLIKESIANE